MNQSDHKEKLSRNSKFEILKKVELFQSFPDKSLNDLADHCKYVRIGDQHLLCKEGDPGNKMWVVVSGKLMVFKLKKTIAIIGESNFFGEMALIDNQPRAASVRGVGDVVLLEIDDVTFKKLILSEPHAMVPFLHVIASRTRHNLDIIVSENQRMNFLVHDMRNYLVPLSISEGYMEKLILLLDGVDGQKRRQGFEELSIAMKKMVAARNNLITLIDQTLSMGVNSKLDYVKKPAKLFEMVKETTEETIFHKHVKGKELNAYIPEDFNKETFCNILDLKRVLQNLIVNAGYASHKGGKIEVYLKDEGDEVQISVVDHGSGIPDDVQPLLLKEQYTSKTDGNGFGLMSCREIIEEYHDGKLGFETEFGKGTTFYFRIPN